MVLSERTWGHRSTMQCPVLRERMALRISDVMSGTELAYGAPGLRVQFVMSGMSSGMGLRVHSAMSGTELGYGASRRSCLCTGSRAMT
eukprot:2278401-Rhodomonas_salina.3